MLASETETVQGSRMVEIILDKCGPVIARLREASAGGGNTVLDRASDRYRRVAGAMMGLWGEAVPGWRVRRRGSRLRSRGTTPRPPFRDRDLFKS